MAEIVSIERPLEAVRRASPRSRLADRAERAWAWLWVPPEAEELAECQRGERVVAWARIAVAGLAFAAAFGHALRAQGDADSAQRLVLHAGAFAAAVLILLIARAGTAVRWLSFVTAPADVTVVTLAVAGVLLAGTPGAAVHASLLLPLYVLLVMANLLRNDARVCVVVGLTALLQYEGLLVWLRLSQVPGSDLHRHLVQDAVPGLLELGPGAILALATALSIHFVKRGHYLRLLSTRDALTGLANRPHFEEQLWIEMRRAQRNAEPLAVAMVDIDEFKRFNDDHGHSAGDRALRTVAGVLRRGLRSTDLVARYGGDELVVLLGGSAGREAAARLESLRVELAATPIFHDGDELRGITISAGVAEYPRDGEGTAPLLAVADRRLYRAKREGRNRLVGYLERADAG